MGIDEQCKNVECVIKERFQYYDVSLYISFIICKHNVKHRHTTFISITFSLDEEL